MKGIRFILINVIGIVMFPFMELQGQDMTYVHDIITKLASREYFGRGYVPDGALKAAAYIKNQYAEMQLKPFGGEYCQPFQLKVNTFPGKISLKIDNQELVAARDYLVDPSSKPLKGQFELYFIKGEELFNDELLQKAVKLCKDKILVIDSRQKDAIPDQKKANDIIRFLKYDPSVKSAATFIWTSGKLTWGTSPVQAKTCITLSSQVVIQPDSRVNISIESRIENVQAVNVIGYIEGKVRPDSFLVVTAHYDHLGQMGSDVYFPGANDNASGIAMLLNLAQYFGKNVPDYSMAFIAFSGEEAGLLGASYYTEHPLFDLARIKFLVNFDLAGTGDEGIKVVNGSVYQQQFKKLKQYNDERQLLKSVQTRGKACNSDHCLFDNKGVPAFYIYTLGGSTAYHDLDDTAENLSLIEFQDYFQLMVHFFSTF